MIWLIADTHFFHENIIKYCGRPFNNVFEMNDKLIENWNKKVKNGDIIIHLGDFGKKNISEIRQRLNGIIILLRGNHDNNIQFEDGFIIVEGTITMGKYILSHEPLEESTGLINVHGHIHEKESLSGINISVERIGYEPINIEDLKKF